jgi:hypothetical protein
MMVPDNAADAAVQVVTSARGGEGAAECRHFGQIKPYRLKRHARPRSGRCLLAWISAAFQ